MIVHGHTSPLQLPADIWRMVFGHLHTNNERLNLSSTSRLHRRVSETTGLCQIELSDKTVVLIAHIMDRPWVAGALRYTPVISVEKLTLGALDKDTTHLQALAAACDVKALRDLKIWVFDHSFVPWLGLFHQCAAQLATFHITGVGLSAFSEDPTGSGLPEMPLLTHLKMDASPTEQCLKQLIKLVESVKLDTLDLRGFDWRFKWNILRATQGTIRKLFTWGWETDYAEHLPALKIIELFSDYDRWTQDGIVPPAPDLPQTLEVLHLGRCSSRSRQDRVLRTWLSDATWLPNLKIITADFSGDYYETCPASPALEEICAQRGLKVTFIEPAEGFVPRIVHVVDD